MKKILIATTALVATAGFAAADVSLSGDARMGVLYDGEDLVFTSRTRATITLSGESDGGLSFGGSFGVHDSVGAKGGTAGSVFVSGGFGKLSMGDVDGAAKAAVGDIDGVGLTGLSDINEMLYVNGGTDLDGNGVDDTFYPNPAALWEFSTGDFTFFAGAGMPGGQVSTNDRGDFDPTNDIAIFADNTYSFGAGWGANGYSVAIGYETTDALVSVDNLVTIQDLGTISQWVIGGSAEFGDFTVKANYAAATSDGGDGTQWGISGTYAMDALSVTGFYVDRDFGPLDSDGYGLGVAYDLGGGLSVKGGVVQNYAGDTIADLGLSMSF